MLSLSVPPDVNMISSGLAPISAATCSRAFAILSSTELPNVWKLEGFP